MHQCTWFCAASYDGGAGCCPCQAAALQCASPKRGGYTLSLTAPSCFHPHFPALSGPHLPQYLFFNCPTPNPIPCFVPFALFISCTALSHPRVLSASAIVPSSCTFCQCHRCYVNTTDVYTKSIIICSITLGCTLTHTHTHKQSHTSLTHLRCRRRSWLRTRISSAWSRRPSDSLLVSASCSSPYAHAHPGVMLYHRASSSCDVTLVILSSESHRDDIKLT
jgi:hypothetical protein